MAARHEPRALASYADRKDSVRFFGYLPPPVHDACVRELNPPTLEGAKIGALIPGLLEETSGYLIDLGSPFRRG